MVCDWDHRVFCHLLIAWAAAQENRLWVDKYAPETEVDLAVHKQKIEDVRRWLREAFSTQPISKYRRLLVLTGPSGAGKTATLRVLSGEMGFSVIEWISAQQSPLDAYGYADENISGDDLYESAMDKFETFLARAGNYRSVFNNNPAQSSSSDSPTQNAVILLEDLPNILHEGIRQRFHSAIHRHVQRSTIPVIIVVSDAGVRGETEEVGAGPLRWSRNNEVSARFNPIAVTFLTSALKRVRIRAGAAVVSDSVLTNIVESVSGDIRAAIMALEFTAVRAGAAGSQKRGRNGPANASLESLTRKENALVLFHLLGKVLYNKRKGDPPPNHATKREATNLRKIDSKLKDEPPLQAWFNHEARATSRVSADELYSSTPIDASLFSLYIHQNYTPFCATLEHSDALIDNLSWVDANGGDNWYEQNPYAFHLYALGTLHALPTPVPHVGQKFYKPELFDVGKRAHEASNAIDRVRGWLSDRSPENASTWTRTAVALELGVVLRAKDMGMQKPPHGHGLFSEMRFVHGAGNAEVAGERETGGVPVSEEEPKRRLDGDDAQGTWLEDDDIEDW
ncbi:Rad17 cell cycle checkpoint protein-domain-containing protein [Vararia minispora EC-137]|uniref:Rad17 cell cycle checkpoint protein-domain-containing protein n=1 Tax=Vararia minispora EC-137 TaxID=1314806 RepID=A0ACB8Q7W7_9AGAM|nr:Rad17 cell cycle checkpoint protein-domain-containing protein [Vararia minispora EC-137]